MPRRVDFIYPTGGHYSDWTGTYSSGIGSANAPNSISGVSNPNYQVTISNGGDATSDYSLTYHTCQPAYCGDRVRYPWDPTASWAEQMGFVPVTFPSAVTDATVDNRALTAVRNKLNGSTKQFKALAPLAELKDMRGMINSVASSALTMTRALVDLKQGKVRDAASRASDIWLTFNFGVSPMISDIQKASESIDSYMRNQVPRIDISGFAATNRPIDYGIGDLKQVSMNYRYRRSGMVDISYKYGGAFAPSLSSSNDYGIMQHMGITSQDIIPAAWELVPYSWVVDYFTNAQEYLSDRFTAPAGTTIYLYRNYKCVISQELQLISKWPSSERHIILIDKWQPGHVKSVWFSRSKLSALPTRSFEFKTFDTVGHHGVTKLLNLAAILAK